MGVNRRNTTWADWKADLRRYPKWSLITQPALWAIGVYRLGRWTLSLRGPLSVPMHMAYYLLFSGARLLTGIEIPRSARIGGGLMIHHFGGVIIHPQTVAGRGLTMRQGVTIGSRVDGGGVPVLGDSVSLGAYAQVLGDIRVADGATVGALTLVLADVGTGATVVGIPAREVSPPKQGPE